ncbi:uncharacterized protein LOC120121391 [Hibiscus syriacus]|uniref:uncharacterized protein LOC120121391 n=1 Tax=Hibiscus syriacus TaxID=106335 RepID=UPI0019225A38|nr:uncharacterized protein LOC120121391 [Hibiscus syriacus]
MGASKNKFKVLNSIDPERLLSADDSGKKQRAASLGVAKLVQDLKLKKKEQVDKVKKMEDREGDFNIILNTEERTGSVNASTHADILDFRSCVENMGIFDHPFTRSLFTWSNKQHDYYLARKLDRVLQKAKANWINEGDQETRFFHSMVARRRKSSTIRVIYDQSGVKLDTFDDMYNEVIKFFQNQLGTTDVNVKCSNIATIKELLNYSLPLGVDVVSSGMYPMWRSNMTFGDKRGWSIIGEDFIAAIRYCFEISFILSVFNSTTVVLVPKVPNPSIVKDFIHISCCTVIYKTITRILVRLLSTVFPSMISKNQTAFVKGRSIVDNTLLAQELVRGYNRKNISSRCALKIDLQKAFDSLD